MLRAKVSRTQPPTAHFDGRTPSRTPATPAKPSAPVCDLAESPRAFAPVKGVLKLSLRFNTGATHELAVKADTKVSQIKLDIQRRTAIHVTNQRLVFAGQSLDDSKAVGETSLVDGASVFVLVNTAFPATLGPFNAESVPFGHGDFETPPLGACDFDTQGAMWQMGRRSVTRRGVRGTGAEFPLAGQFSPPHPVTLTAEEKLEIGIPAQADRFVWSYPVASWRAIGDAAQNSAHSFLSVGGFAYLGADNRILHTTTIMPSGTDAGGLQFGKPTAWRAEWSAALMRHGRFQRITIAPLNALGAHHFCWLRPGEVLLDAGGRPFAQQPHVPHGGFAYLFHDDVFDASADELNLDRYFACTSGDEYVPADEGDDLEEGSARRTFALVSGLQELQALHEAAAAAPPSAALQEQVARLQAELQQVTKCIACTESDKDTILNCGHMCMCAACAARVTTCPICRAPVRERRRAFQ